MCRDIYYIGKDQVIAVEIGTRMKCIVNIYMGDDNIDISTVRTGTGE